MKPWYDRTDRNIITEKRNRIPEHIVTVINHLTLEPEIFSQHIFLKNRIQAFLIVINIIFSFMRLTLFNTYSKVIHYNQGI